MPAPATPPPPSEPPGLRVWGGPGRLGQAVEAAAVVLYPFAVGGLLVAAGAAAAVALAVVLAPVALVAWVGLRAAGWEDAPLGPVLAATVAGAVWGAGRWRRPAAGRAPMGAGR